MFSVPGTRHPFPVPLPSSRARQCHASRRRAPGLREPGQGAGPGPRAGGGRGGLGPCVGSGRAKCPYQEGDVCDGL